MLTSLQKRVQWAATVGCAVLSFSAAAQDSQQPQQDGILAQAAEEVRRYSVEVIVFEYSSSVSAGNEIFKPGQPPSEADISATDDLAGTQRTNGEGDDVIEYGDPGTTYNSGTKPGGFGNSSDSVGPAAEEIGVIPALSSVDFRLLTTEEKSMGGIYDKLRRLDAYTPVLWAGWVQSVREHETTPLVRLRALGTPPLHIDGTLNLYLRNYLHLVVDITRELQVATVQPVYRQEKRGRGRRASSRRTSYGITDPQTVLFQIQEDRIFNSGHLRYFDHPRFGLLATVHRVEEIPEDELPGSTMSGNDR